MTQRPDKLKIGHLDYDIQWVGEAWTVENDRTGEISFVRQRITINETLRPEKLADTCLHEIIHAITNHFDRVSNDPMPREQVAEWVSAGLVMVWRDNPAAFEWLRSLLA